MARGPPVSPRWSLLGTELEHPRGVLRIRAPRPSRLEREVDPVWLHHRPTEAPEAMWRWALIARKCRDTYALMDEYGTILVLWGTQRPRITVLDEAYHKVDYLEVNPDHRRKGLGNLALALAAHRGFELGCVGLAIPALPERRDYYLKLGAEPFPHWSIMKGLVALRIVGPAFDRLRGVILP